MKPIFSILDTLIEAWIEARKAYASRYVHHRCGS
jgi:hypothetical protein